MLLQYHQLVTSVVSLTDVKPSYLYIATLRNLTSFVKYPRPLQWVHCIQHRTVSCSLSWSRPSPWYDWVRKRLQPQLPQFQRSCQPSRALALSGSTSLQREDKQLREQEKTFLSHKKNSFFGGGRGGGRESDKLGRAILLLLGRVGTYAMKLKA